MAAAAAGMGCTLVMYGEEPRPTHPNLALARAAGAEVQFTRSPARESVDLRLLEVEAELRRSGERPYPVPRGGATAVAALGFAHAAAELGQQLAERGIHTATILLASGSGVSQAGLVAGSLWRGSEWRVVGASVSRPRDEADAQVRRLATDCAALLNLRAAALPEIDIRDARGAGYGIPSQEAERATVVALRECGLVLDPVFTAKAFVLLPEVARASDAQATVFWHTGGIPVALDHLVRVEGAAHQSRYDASSGSPDDRGHPLSQPESQEIQV